MNVVGIVWMGVRTPAFAELRHLFATVMGMPVTHDGDGVTWFGLDGGEEIQIYAGTDVDHTFFADGPVVGFLVDDFDAARAELEAADVEFIGSGDATSDSSWQHFRGPDGNVYEIMGPAR